MNQPSTNAQEFRATGPAANSSSSLRSGLRTILADALELAELQARLAKCEGQQAIRRSRPAVLVLLFGILAAIGGVPIIVLASAAGLAEQLEVATWITQLICAAVSVAVGAVCVWLAMRRLSNVTDEFGESATEFQKNLAWMRSLTSSPRRTPECENA